MAEKTDDILYIPFNQDQLKAHTEQSNKDGLMHTRTGNCIGRHRHYHRGVSMGYQNEPCVLKRMHTVGDRRHLLMKIIHKVGAMQATVSLQNNTLTERETLITVPLDPTENPVNDKYPDD